MAGLLTDLAVAGCIFGNPAKAVRQHCQRDSVDGLGKWHQQQRNLYDDYQHYMGQPPARIVKLWLIANSVFQRKSGTCDYADIVLHSDASRVKLL